MAKKTIKRRKSSSKRSSKRKERTFTIHDARKADGCPTKFMNKNYSGVYVSRDAAGSAKKALTQLCNVKNIKGQCAMYLSIRETTQGSKKKVFNYKVVREKLKKPLELKGRIIEYQNKAKSVKTIPAGKSCKKSSGTRRSKTNRSFKR
jgi:hypothetical protein